MHDQHFKDLLQRFFGDFIRIVLPGMAPLLELESARFLDKEAFTDIPEGERRLLDLLAEVDTTSGETDLVLVHVEIEAEARGAAMDDRMWRYAMQLWLRDNRTVVPIVLYLRGGEPDVSEVTVESRFAGRRLATFTYWAFGLSRSDAAKYIDRPEALAPALAALMDRGGHSAAEHRHECLRRIARIEIDDAGRYLLVNTVETYVRLDDEGLKEYARLLAQDPNQEVRIMELTWGDQIKEQGRVEGLVEGREEGRLEGMRALLLDVIEQRFGAPSEDTKDRVQGISSAEELTELARRAVSASSLGELGL